MRWGGGEGQEGRSALGQGTLFSLPSPPGCFNYLQAACSLSDQVMVYCVPKFSTIFCLLLGIILSVNDDMGISQTF